MTTLDLEIGRRYGVCRTYSPITRQWNWCSRAEESFATLQTAAVVVHRLDAHTFRAVDFSGKPAEIPTRAFRDEMPWTQFSDGAAILIDRSPYRILEGSDQPDGAQIYRMHTSELLKRAPNGEWILLSDPPRSVTVSGPERPQYERDAWLSVLKGHLPIEHWPVVPWMLEPATYWEMPWWLLSRGKTEKSCF